MLFDSNILIQAANNANLSIVSIQEYIAECVTYERHLHDLAHSKQNMDERKSYASWIFQFTCLWCIGLFIVLIGCGSEKLKLSTTVITTLIGSTTVNVFIFFKLVTEYLFNKDKPHD